MKQSVQDHRGMLKEKKKKERNYSSAVSDVGWLCMSQDFFR